MDTTEKFYFLIALILVSFVPFIFLWSLNTLFPILEIPYNWQTWLASLIILGFYHGKYHDKKR